METLISISEAQEYRVSMGQSAKIAFVPTMGALHEGHLNLVQQAKARADAVVVSIFVNPTQFGPNEDFSRYPRTLESDVSLLARENIDALFLPTAASMFSSNFSTYVTNPKTGSELCGKSRPNHFQGVLTVVLKLLNIIKPHIALFGKKDYQQLFLIKKMVVDLNLSVAIHGVETKRDPDGLALSSRNIYLSKKERIIAPQIYRALRNAREAATEISTRTPGHILRAFSETIEPYPELNLEYIELRRQEDLTPIREPFSEAAVLLTALRLGSTRLIDNIEIDDHET